MDMRASERILVVSRTCSIRPLTALKPTELSGGVQDGNEPENQMTFLRPGMALRYRANCCIASFDSEDRRVLFRSAHGSEAHRIVGRGPGWKRAGKPDDVLAPRNGAQIPRQLLHCVERHRRPLVCRTQTCREGSRMEPSRKTR